jgi:hypothetical protein
LVKSLDCGLYQWTYAYWLNQNQKDSSRRRSRQYYLRLEHWKYFKLN